jgi:hypothetical protein
MLLPTLRCNSADGGTSLFAQILVVNFNRYEYLSIMLCNAKGCKTVLKVQLAGAAATMFKLHCTDAAAILCNWLSC